MRRRRVIRNALIAGAVIGGIVAYLVVSRARRTAQVMQGIITGTVTRGDIVETVSATGSVNPQTGAMVRIGSQVTGEIKRLYADIGSEVKAGQVIAEVAVPELEAQLREAEAALAGNQQQLAQQQSGVPLQDTQSETDLRKAQAALRSAQTSLEQAKASAKSQVGAAEAAVSQAEANARNAASNLARQQQLYDAGFIAAADLDAARTQSETSAALLESARQNLSTTRATATANVATAQSNLEQAQASLAAAQAAMVQREIKRQQLRQAQAAVRQAAAAVNYAQIRRNQGLIKTPISGTVLQLAQQAGETVAAALAAPTLIVVADLNRLQVDAFVDETDIGKVRLGQRAEVTVDAYPNRTFHGTVQKIASAATIEQNVVTYDVTIELENTNHLLKPNMTATANITVARHNDVLMVPVDAVKPSVTGDTVTVVSERRGKKPEFKVVPVKTGISDGVHTEIVSGLKEGQTVVLAGRVPGTASQPSGPRPPGLFGPAAGGGGRGGGRSG